MDDLILQVNHLSKSFGTHEVLKDIDFTVKKGDVTSIIGASGSGKSTLLRCINLLETPSSGEILYHGKNVVGRGVNQPEYRSHVGMVFQSFNLFNNMTVLENCMVGQIKVLKRGKAEAREAAMTYLTKVGMAPYINAKPRQISGGQKQRVAVGPGGHDHAGGDPRDGLRPGREQPRGLHGKRHHLRTGQPRRAVRESPEAGNQGLPGTVYEGIIVKYGSPGRKGSHIYNSPKSCFHCKIRITASSMAVSETVPALTASKTAGIWISKSVLHSMVAPACTARTAASWAV